MSYNVTCTPTCDTCRHYLDGGCCRINLEAECGKGEFEAWEPKRGSGHNGHEINSGSHGGHEQE